MPDRIQKILASRGVASRRKAEQLIRDGRVTVNGKIAELGQSAGSCADMIAVDGVPLAHEADSVYIMLNKPRGYLTTMSDDRGRPVVTSLVADAGVRVFPVGRLDMDTEGLLLLTNDGEFANAVAHPSFNKIKTYEVHVRGPAKEAARRLRFPIEIDSRVIQAVSVALASPTEDGGLLSIRISEGRNRQIRRMCAACGLVVLSLRRVSIGSLKLGDLETGKWRYLTEEEVKELRVKS